MSGAVQRVAILGAESSGKSTLAEALAAHYGSVWVPEYLREFVDTHARVPFESDQYPIARTQRAREDAAAARATRFLFCDTTPLMTALYSRQYWGRVDPQLARLDGSHDYAFTFVTAPDGPWEPDGLQRESEEVRQKVHRMLVQTLDARAIPYVLLAGSLPERLRQVEALLGAA
ncbi:AAA family ATPase [Massilia yuzhufengensis]|uniref:Nicotinamide-nucleotide adenylyltransferase, NadR type n=1 Tax=Massilia yuzhufengensis TaxID=1164594 RepID=A0A1I1GPM7_9BURK|nr:ATP-binding protein [Massilia yuzhufengensis]SFC13707.1 nicotinamide-nucleotide adenylyltransferase, NadR type [Massilia yuzhufengensis]